jgi:Tol biopolymer transport system component
VAALLGAEPLVQLDRAGLLEQVDHGVAVAADRITKAVSIVPVGAMGSVEPDVSADGRFITLVTVGKLVSEDENPGGDVYVYDTVTRTFELVTRSTTGEDPGSAWSKETSISDDGRFVGFQSDGTNIVPGKRGHQVYLFDRTTKKTMLVSRNAAGHAGDDLSEQPTLSRNGRWITFISRASNLVPGDTNTDYDVFLFDRMTNKLALVSATPAGTPGDARSLYPAISGDGRFVSFSSKATNLVPAQPEPEPGHAHVFRYDHQAKVLDVVSVPASGKGGGFMSAMSQNGAVLAFDSAAAGFVANDSNDTYDIFVQQR